MSTPVEKIKERLNILDVVGSYVKLQKAGKSYKGKSPFTSEKTPSFFVSPERGMYYCFSSSRGGDMFTFIQEMEGVDFRGALKILAERAGVELTPESPEARTEREQLYAILESATQFFETHLKRTPQVREYLEKRGVTTESTASWRIGYAPDAWRSLKEYLLERKFSEALIMRSGLIKRSDEGKESYDVFRDRVMFPISDASGRVVAFSGRRFTDDPAAPKYVNSPETELFVKSEILFGYHQAKSGIRSYDFSLVVEGQFDLVLSHQVGYTNTIAISGTALSPQHVTLLQRLSNRIVLALDSDAAGVASVKRSAQLLLARGMDVKVARMEGGKDPADLAKEDPTLLKRAIGSATHVVPFLIAVIKSEMKDERTFRLRVRDEVVPFVAAIPDRIDREFFEQMVAEAIGSTVDAVRFEVERVLSDTQSAKAPEQVPERVVAPPKATEVREDVIVAHLYGLLLWLDTVEDTVMLTEIPKVRLREDIVYILGEEGMRSLDDWPPEVKNEALFKVEQAYDIEGARPRLGGTVSELLSELHVRRLKRLLQSAKESLAGAERSGDTERAEKLLNTCHELQKKLSEVHSGTLFQYTRDGT